jgi:cell division protein ZapA (FtsZ GTPase activity inhibitor)
MSKGPVELQIGGHSYRVSTTAPPDVVQRTARIVDRRLQELPVAQRHHPSAMLLVALSLAHDLELERSQRTVEATRNAARARKLLHRVDAALGSVNEDGEALSDV